MAATAARQCRFSLFGRYASASSPASKTRQLCTHTQATRPLVLSPPVAVAERRSARTTSKVNSCPTIARPFSACARLPAKAIINPRKDENGEEMVIEITPRAAHRLHAISTQDGNPDLALRVSVESGGCHGFQYLMSLANIKDISQEEDTVFESEDGKGAKVVMDEPSLELLKGSKIDYTMELIGSQFKVTGIPGATSSCGCGSSFDIGT